MTDVAAYAGDDYIVRPHGLDPFGDDLDFLPWSRVNSYWVLPQGREETSRAAKALEHHPVGTPLHDDRPLASRVEDHFTSYGTSTGEVADRIEHLVRGADPWMATYGAGWYEHEGGNPLRRLGRVGYGRQQAAQITADLSPQNTWVGTPDHPELGNREEAVRYGRECSDMRHGIRKYEDHVLTVSDADADRAHATFKDAALLPGRYDISHPDPAHWDISPKQMCELPQFHSRAGRRERSNAISSALGLRSTDDLGPKTGPFCHNIEHPYDSPLVTTDTHIVDATGLDLPRAQKSRFLGGVGGVHNEHQRIGLYKGYGYVGIASAVTEVANRMNRKPGWNRGGADLLPLHVQAVAWNEHLNQTSGRFRRNVEPLREMPWDQVWGYNFGVKATT